MAKLLYQGHGSYRVTTSFGTVLYVDPYAGEGYDLPADLVLITHEHYDHNDLSKITQKPGCIILRAADMLVGGSYQRRTIGDVTVEAVPACNQNHKITECVGYVVETDGRKIYFSGDTSELESMSELAQRHLDYALLPVDGVYNMDAKEAARCAQRINAKHTIPIHTCFDKCYDPAIAAGFIHPSALYLAADQEIVL